MSINNIYIEKFTELIDASNLSMVDFDDIREALRKLDEFDKEIHKKPNNNVPIANDSWFRYRASEFGEWLRGHIIGASSGSIFNAFYNDSGVIRACTYNNQMDDMLYQIADEFGAEGDPYNLIIDLDETELGTLESIMDFASSTQDVFYRFYSSDFSPCSIFVPGFAQDYEENYDNEKKISSFWRARARDIAETFAIMSVESQIACVSVITRDENNHYSCTILPIIGGIHCPLGASDIESYVNKFAEVNSLGYFDSKRDRGENARTDYEMAAIDLANIMENITMLTFSDCAFLLEKDKSRNNAGVDGASLNLSVSLSPFFYFFNSEDEVIKLLVVDDNQNRITLNESYECIKNGMGDLTSAQRFVTASAVLSGAVEHFVNGETGDAQEQIQDFLTMIDLAGLSSDKSDTGDDGLAFLRDYELQAQENREDAIYKEMFETQDKKTKSRILAFSNALRSRKNMARFIISLDETSVKDGQVRGHTMLMPPEMSDKVKEKIKDVENELNAICMRSMMGSHTMVIMMIDPSNLNGNIEISGMKWNKNGWKDLGKDNTLELVANTSIGEMIGYDGDFETGITYVTINDSDNI